MAPYAEGSMPLTESQHRDSSSYASPRAARERLGMFVCPPEPMFVPRPYATQASSPIEDRVPDAWWARSGNPGGEEVMHSPRFGLLRIRVPVT